MQFIDLASQQKRIKGKIDNRIQSVLQHGKYIMGPEVLELEKRLAGYVGTKHAISCASGTDGLLLALMAKGVGRGDAIITSTFTFIATAEVISLLGATPIFVDIDRETYNIDPKEIERAVKDAQKKELKVKGIIPVDLFGLPADYSAILPIAEAHNLFILSDAAQSFGAEYKEQKAASLSEVTCTSFFPAKPLGCYGDGGMCFTNDDELHEIMYSIRVHGKGSHKYDNKRIGINGRLDTLQAAILLEKFEIFPEEFELRQKVAETYSGLLSSNNRQDLTIPSVPSECRSAWAQYSVMAKNEQHRSNLQAKLKEEGIPTAIYYPKPLHLQTAFKDLKYGEGSFPVSEKISKRIFSLPMHPYLKEEDQKTVVEAINHAG
jgi:UDP-2-acetamido-2-deoxy-ribo-hexuluronate aminotransferase